MSDRFMRRISIRGDMRFRMMMLEVVGARIRVGA